MSVLEGLMAMSGSGADSVSAPGEGKVDGVKDSTFNERIGG